MTLHLRPLTDEEAKSFEWLFDHVWNAWVGEEANSFRVGDREITGNMLNRFQYRAYMIYHIAYENETFLELLSFWGYDEKWLRRWIKRFNIHGLPGLLDGARPGRPKHLSESDIARIRGIYYVGPAAVGLDIPRWTINALRDYLAEKEGIAIGRTRMAEMMNEADLYQPRTHRYGRLR
jgi:transposase